MNSFQKTTFKVLFMLGLIAHQSAYANWITDLGLDLGKAGEKAALLEKAVGAVTSTGAAVKAGVSTVDLARALTVANEAQLAQIYSRLLQTKTMDDVVALDRALGVHPANFDLPTFLSQNAKATATEAGQKLDALDGHGGGATNDAASGAPKPNGKPLVWADANKEINDALIKLASRSPAEQAEAIEKLGALKIDINSLKGIKPGEYNEQIMGVVDRLAKFVKSTGNPELQKKAMEAMVTYAKTNSGNWKLGFLGRRAPEVLDSIVADYNYSDDIRRIAHSAADEAYRANGFNEGAGQFVTAQALRQRDTVPFLNQTYRELNHSQQSIARDVSRNFGTKPIQEQKAIYDSWTRAGEIPQQYRAEYVAGMEFRNSNSLMGLDRAGLGYGVRRTGDSVEYYNRATNTFIIIKEPGAGMTLRQFTPEEVAQLRQAMTKGGTVDLGYVGAGRGPR